MSGPCGGTGWRVQRRLARPGSHSTEVVIIGEGRTSAFSRRPVAAADAARYANLFPSARPHSLVKSIRAVDIGLLRDHHPEVLQRSRTTTLSRGAPRAPGEFDFDGEMLAGAIDSRTALRLIREWATPHRGELEDNWRLAKIRQPLRQVAPLE
jgi:hypothetical protein